MKNFSNVDDVGELHTAVKNVRRLTGQHTRRSVKKHWLLETEFTKSVVVKQAGVETRDRQGQPGQARRICLVAQFVLAGGVAP